MLTFACISPHPPIILPSVGSPKDREKVKKTISALEKLGKELAKTKPDCIIISSPHPDWGIKVPLYFLIVDSGKWKVESYQKALSHSPILHSPFSILSILTTLDSPKQHFQWGQKIASAIPPKQRVAWVASGDMSHCLKKDGPYGFNPSGPKFDQEFIRLLKKKDVSGILNMNEKLVRKAGECGLRSFCMLLGALEWQSSSAGLKPSSAWKPKILSYEGPFGVGYLVARLV